jgi:two-component system OmpR family response regulator
MDGRELLRRLRAQAPAVPALFLTARESAQDRALSFAAGGDDHMRKPFSLTELVTRLTRLLHRAGRIGGSEEPRCGSTTSAETPTWSRSSSRTCGGKWTVAVHR